MRKSEQDKAFDKALRLLPALSNDDLAVIIVACNNIVQARSNAKRRALNPQRIPTRQRDEAKESSDVPA